MILVNILVGIVGIVAFFWLMLGMPVGIIWFLISFLNTSNTKKKKTKPFPVVKWLVFTFGGLGLMFVSFFLYALLFTLNVVSGM